ncbi:MAG: DNA-formamidopyrimidine glycosylase [Candidatus Omnitrophota bacterium]|nr:MAG: DNA-formamidopyrimidine glycosylase [Candidatus Omnitrophota bacterium]
MPELPEVETIRLQLRRSVLNKKIKDVIVKDARVIKGISGSAFKTKVKNKTIKDVIRRGKVLILELGSSLYLVIHLRISGWLRLNKGIEKFCRVGFVLNNGRILNFCDSRVLGEIKLIGDYEKLPIIKSMGPEPLGLGKAKFIKLFEKKTTKIKPLLMDQNFLAGVGNIYAQEALFCAGVKPERKSNEIDKKELEKIYTCLISILRKAISKKGASVDTYRQIDGDEGEYIPLLKVYQRQAKPCFKCKSPIRRKSIGGRGTYFCPRCQK